MRTFQEFVSEMTYGRGRGPIGRADRNSGRNRYLGSPTPEQEKENKSAADKAAADAVAKLRRARAREMKEEVELGEGIGMTMASALGNPPPLSKRMKLKQALIINKIESDAKKNKKKKYSGKALGEDNVQELFITKLTPEQKRKKKVETLIRLMQHAKDPAADTAKTKK